MNNHTYTGWGSVTHWNAYVANTQMRGKGTFFDPRLNDPEKFPVAVKTKDWNIRNDPDLVTAKLPALHFYQLSHRRPEAAGGQLRQGGRGARAGRSSTARRTARAATCRRCSPSRAGRCTRPPRSASTTSRRSARPTSATGRRRCKGLWAHIEGRLLPRRAVRDAAGRHRPLQRPLQAGPDRTRDQRPGRVPEVACRGLSNCFVQANRQMMND